MRNPRAVFCLLIACALAPADTLDAILGRMDKAAPNFHSLTAAVSMDTFESLLNDHTIETGTLRMQRQGTDIRAILAFEGKGNDARTLFFKGHTVQMYYPNSNSYQIFDLGTSSQVLNQFLLLGFGSSGKELAQSYTISVLNSENVTGIPTTKLQLIPKDPQVLQRLTKIAIWIPGDQAYPVQQQFYESSGNSRTITYTQIVLNPPLKGTLEFKLPNKAKKI